jgi:hypothetical protein
MPEIDGLLREDDSAGRYRLQSWRRKEQVMNARYPTSSTGMWGQVKRSHVVAAIAATVGVMVGAAGAAAWDARDDSDSSGRVYAPPPVVNIDRLAEAARQAPPSFGDTSGGDRISQFGRGFVDVESLEATLGPITPDVTAETPVFGPEFVDVASLEAAIAQHENALAGNGATGGEAETGGGTDRAGRGQVFSE